MKRQAFTDRADGEWFDLERQYRIACCDCGLVHRLELRMRKGVVQMRAFRDEPATRQRRKTAAPALKIRVG